MSDLIKKTSLAKAIQVGNQEFLRKFIPMGDPRKIETENNKRPDHSDFMTTSELKAAKFSGWRHNKVLEEMELWQQGIIQGTLCAKNGPPSQEKIHALMAKVFAMYE
jgi:hypothetical protein